MAIDHIEDHSAIVLENVRIAGKTSTSCSIHCRNGLIECINTDASSSASHSTSLHRLLVPGLCHPHIHLDKCFLLSHPKYEDLEIKEGDFAEAMKITSEAKSRFEHEDLMERGRALIEESIQFGVTHMRAFVEVDFGVRMKCLDAGLALKREFSDRCYVQICVFAQDPIFSQDNVDESMTDLLEEAIKKPGVEVLGSTPYVEKNPESLERNIQWTVEKAKFHKLHLDFHIDYNLDPSKEVSILSAIEKLHQVKWPTNVDAEDYKTVMFGHCTRLTLFANDDWQDLRRAIGDLPVSFVGLPTSDLFMMGRPGNAGGSNRVRGTLQVLEMIKKYGLNVAMGINNVGNAFTPQGSCDPMSLASLGVGIYQAGTKADAELLLECVSTRARVAIGLGKDTDLKIESGGPADFVTFNSNESGNFRARKSIQELVYDAGHSRTTVFRGKIVTPS